MRFRPPFLVLAPRQSAAAPRRRFRDASGKEQLHPAFFAFWPGPLTLVLAARAGLFNPKLVDARGKIALRVTPHPAARALARAVGGPLTATSANLQGRPPARLAGELDPALLAHLSEANIEADIMTNMLRAFSIPVFRVYPNDGDFGRIILGFSGSGVEIYVPETMLADAQNLISADIEPETEGET